MTKPDSSSTANSVFSIGESRETSRKSACEATARTSSGGKPRALELGQRVARVAGARGPDGARSRGRGASRRGPTAPRPRRTGGRRRASPPRRRARACAGTRDSVHSQKRDQASSRERGCDMGVTLARRSTMEKFVIEGGVPLSGTDRARRQQERGAAAAGRAASSPTSAVDAAQRPAHPRHRGDARAAGRPRRRPSSAATTTPSRCGARDIRTTDVDPALAERIRASFLVAGPLLARFGSALMPPPGGDVIGRRRLDPHLDAFRALGAEVEHGRDIRLSAPNGGLRAVRLLHGRAVRDGHRERADGRRADRRARP